MVKNGPKKILFFLLIFSFVFILKTEVLAAPSSEIKSPDPSWSWIKDPSFKVIIEDSGATGGCFYKILDVGRGIMTPERSRTCNNPLFVSVGSAPADCQTNGKLQCSVIVYAKDAAGNIGSSVATYDIDWEDPQAAVTVPPADSWKKGNFTAALAYTDGGGSTLAECQAHANSSPLIPSSACAGKNADNFNPNITVSASGMCNTEGKDTCIISLQALDKAGNFLPVTERKVSIDWTAPEVGDVVYDPNFLYQEKDFTASVSDNIKITSCKFYLKNPITKTESEIGDATLSPPSPCPKGKCYTALIKYKLCLNGQMAYFKCYDNTINETNKNEGVGTEVQINSPPGTPGDSTPPISRITDPGAGSNQNFDFWLSAADSDALSGKGTAYYDVFSRNNANQTVSDGKRTWISNPLGGDSVMISVGNKQNCQDRALCKVKVWANDCAGNDGAGTKDERTFNIGAIDKVEPEVEITVPVPPVWKTKPSFKIDLKYSDKGGANSRLKSCQYDIENTGETRLGGISPGASCYDKTSDFKVNNFTINVVSGGTGQNCHKEGAGACIIHAYAEDRHHNSSGDKSAAVNIDWTAPDVGKIAPIKAYTKAPTDFSATTSDKVSGISSCNFIVEGNDKGPMSLSSSPCPAGSICTATKNYTFNNAGTYKVKAKCWDLAGNWLDGPETNVVVNTLPEVKSADLDGKNWCALPGTGQVGFKWKYEDDDDDDQSHYWLRVATDVGFGNIVVNCTDVPQSIPSKSDGTSNVKVVSFPTPGCVSREIGYRGPGNFYYWQVKVKDGKDWSQNWFKGPPFETPSHAYPWPDFLCGGKDCSKIKIIEDIAITLSSSIDPTAYGGATIQSCSWTLPAGSKVVSGDKTKDCTLKVEFAQGINQKISLKATDSSGYKCSIEKLIDVSKPLPEWREAAPSF